MVIWKETFNQKEELPTMRFWLMCKMLWTESHTNIFEKRWTKYISDLKNTLMENMVFSDLEGREKKDSSVIKMNMADKVITKLQRSAYLTIPSAFLTRLGIPRILRK
jgi:hypothetical protein